MGLFSHLGISSYRGIVLPGNNFTFGIEHCSIHWAANTAGSIGIYTSGHTQILNCDLVGYDHGLRICGPGNNVTSCRTEVNRVGMMVGRDLNDVNSLMHGSVIAGNAFEANDTAIYVATASSTMFAGLVILGTVNSPATQSIYGLRVANCTACCFDAILVSDSYSTAAVRIEAAVVYMSLRACSAANSLSDVWSIAGGCPAVFDNCNNV